VCFKLDSKEVHRAECKVRESVLKQRAKNKRKKDSSNQEDAEIPQEDELQSAIDLGESATSPPSSPTSSTAQPLPLAVDAVTGVIKFKVFSLLCSFGFVVRSHRTCNSHRINTG
jgi:hypothetical protein